METNFSECKDAFVLALKAEDGSEVAEDPSRDCTALSRGKFSERREKEWQKMWDERMATLGMGKYGTGDDTNAPRGGGDPRGLCSFRIQPATNC